MKFNYLIVLITIGLFFSSCEVKPKEINYGDDHCKFCDMTVVDKTHASQYVTKKGKAYMFDAVECLVREIVRNDIENTLEFILVSNYSNPGELIDATKTTFLISEKIKSPMGENLSAFKSEIIAKEFQTKYTGVIYTWEQLKTIIK